MTKKKLILLIVTMLGMFMAVFFVILEPLFIAKKTSPIAPLPTPTPVVVISPTRSPNVLPEDLRNAEVRFLQETPTLQRLPARSQFFSIEYIDENHLIVHAKTDNKQRDYQEAKAWFTQNNIDVNNILIEYK